MLGEDQLKWMIAKPKEDVNGLKLAATRFAVSFREPSVPESQGNVIRFLVVYGGQDPFL